LAERGGIRVASDYASGSSTGGIQEAIDDLPSTGGHIYVPGGIYSPNAASTVRGQLAHIHITKNNVHLRFAPDAILRSNHSGGAPYPVMVAISGTTGSSTTLNGAVSARATTITVASATGFSVDDWIYIKQTNILSEVNQIASISGNDLTLYKPLEQDYADASDVVEIDYVKDTEICGGQFDGNDVCNHLISSQYALRPSVSYNFGHDTISPGRHMVFDLYTKDFILFGNKAYDIADNGIEAYATCYNGLVQGNTVEQAYMDGLKIQGAHHKVIGNLASNCGEADSSLYAGFKCGDARSISFVANKSIANRGRGYEVTGAANDISFSSNRAIANGSHGFRLNGTGDARLSGNISLANGGDGFLFEDTARVTSMGDTSSNNVSDGFDLNNADNTFIISPILKENGAYGIDVDANSGNIRILNPYYENNTSGTLNGTAIEVELADGGPLSIRAGASILELIRTGVRTYQFQMGSGGELILRDMTGSADRLAVASDGGILMYSLAAGTTQALAGAAANELWVDTDDANTIKLGT